LAGAGGLMGIPGGFTSGTREALIKPQFESSHIGKVHPLNIDSRD
jgi:hypothetical protein